MLDLSTIVQNVWTVLQPVLPAIAGQGVAALGKNVVGTLWQAIQNKFSGEAHTQKVLVKLLKDPQNTDVQGAFRVALQDALENDGAFAEALAKMVEPAAANEYTAHVSGGGAVAQGPGAKAVGARGVLIEGNSTGNVIITGDHNQALGK